MEQGNEMTVTKDLFRRVGVDEQKSESVVRPSISYWQDAVRRLKQNKVAMVSLVVLLLILVMCAIGPYIYPHPFDDKKKFGSDWTIWGGISSRESGWGEESP